MLKKFFSSPVVSGIALALAVGMILFGGINGVQAAPRIVSADYRAEVVLTNIETALVENDGIAEGEEDLLGMERFRKPNGIDAEGHGFKIGYTYDEKLSVRNVGTIPQYVRVSVYKYWQTADGKRVDLSPELIKLGFVTDGGWTIDEAASTRERTVLYYATPIEPGEDTTLFMNTLTIDPSVVTAVAELADGTEGYKYEGVDFKIKATVDAVQTHNANDAMMSAWGRTN